MFATIRTFTSPAPLKWGENRTPWLMSPGELRAAYVEGRIEVEQFEAGIETWMRATAVEEEEIATPRPPSFVLDTSTLSPDEATI